MAVLIQKIHLGPYIKLLSPRLSETLHDRCRNPNACPDPTGELAKKSKDAYCASCGVLRSQRFEAKEVFPDLGSVFQLFNQEERRGYTLGVKHDLHDLRDDQGGTPTQRATLLLPREGKRHAPRSFLVKGRRKSVEDGSIGKEIQWMKEAFSKELRILEKHFDPEDIYILWGMIAWH